MNDNEVLTQLAQTDAYAPVTQMPSAAWSRETALFVIERRMGMETREPESKQARTVAADRLEPASVRKSTIRRPGLLVASAAFALALLVAAAVAIYSAVDEPVPFGAGSSLALTDEYFAAYNAGDIEAVFGMFTDDATQDVFGEATRLEWQQRVAWLIAQGETRTAHECTVTDEVPGTSVIVSCTFETRDAVHQAIGAPPSATSSVMTITPSGISHLAETYGGPDYADIGGPFSDWMEENHPGVEVYCFEGCGLIDEAIDEAIARGLLQAEYAQEYGAFLEANS